LSRYAQNTSVSPERTQGEITEVLQRYDASDYMTGWLGGKAMVAFKMNNTAIRFLCAMPDPQEKRSTHSGRGSRSPRQAQTAWEQAVRQRWRALLLIIKAKLEAVAAGIATVEEEFLNNVLTPSGRTIGQFVIPQLPEISKGKEINLLPALPATKDASSN
jgi:hypothetical protein